MLRAGWIRIGQHIGAYTLSFFLFLIFISNPWSINSHRKCSNKTSIILLTTFQGTQNNNASYYSWNRRQHHSYHFADIDDTLNSPSCFYWAHPAAAKLVKMEDNSLLSNTGQNTNKSCIQYTFNWCRKCETNNALLLYRVVAVRMEISLHYWFRQITVVCCGIIFFSKVLILLYFF
jgi:hypothetical protein